MIIEKLKNFGEKIIGTDPGSEFKNRYEKYAADHNVPIAEAQKTIFQDVLHDIQDEMKFNGSADPKSKNFRLFEAAMKDIFSPAEMAQFEADAANPNVFRGVTGAPVTTAEYKLSEKHYRNKYDGESPGMTVVRDTAEANKALKELMTRFLNDPSLTTTPDLRAIMAANHEMGADLAKILEMKKRIADHETKFEGQRSFDKSLKSLQSDTKEVLTKKMWKDAGEWLKAVGKSALNPSFQGVFSLMGATAKFALKSIWNGSRLLGKMATTGIKFAAKK